MKLFRILYYKDQDPHKTYFGNYYSIIVKAKSGVDAEKVFAKHLPDKKKDIFGIAEFVHKEWMKPFEELEVYE